MQHCVHPGAQRSQEPERRAASATAASTIWMSCASPCGRGMESEYSDQGTAICVQKAKQRSASEGEQQAFSENRTVKCQLNA